MWTVQVRRVAWRFSSCNRRHSATETISTTTFSTEPRSGNGQSWIRWLNCPRRVHVSQKDINSVGIIVRMSGTSNINRRSVLLWPKKYIKCIAFTGKDTHLFFKKRFKYIAQNCDTYCRRCIYFATQNINSMQQQSLISLSGLHPEKSR